MKHPDRLLAGRQALRLSVGVPRRFLVSGSSEINVDDYTSLASLAALYQEQSLIFNTSYEDIF